MVSESDFFLVTSINNIYEKNNNRKLTMDFRVCGVG
jgi:hypothetical protein